MFNMLSSGRRIMAGLAVLLTVSAAAPAAHASAVTLSPTEAFIQTHLYNPNGTIATRLSSAQSSADPNMAGGRESLSESLGLWMNYAVLKNDAALFKSGYDQLLRNYLSASGLVYWKLSADGTSGVTTNALIDDHKIIDALYSANQKWGKPEYKQMADKLSTFSRTNNGRSGLFADYYDEMSGYVSESVTLSYIVPSALKRMYSNRQIDKSVMNQNLNLLKTMPTDGTFFPKNYNIATKQFTYDSTINMIDQVYIALHRAQNGQTSPALYKLIKKDFYAYKYLVAGYDRTTAAPSVTFECPALYGLSILYALESGDRSFALDLYNRMTVWRVNDPQDPMYGGYVSGGDSYSFDNLYALLAEQALINLKLI
ncbi:glycosyl hydrolase [Paenibacillus sambharensis]|uniref:Glycosyl hydrolase n=1 Tax=Paenibacillus sambharensis TaxID=1803190 RepID=A0A2W1LAP9_9BACL|nr:glycosyl hydrolase [Paenibacillus sambharensis]PZD96296.1 glycosyl hydrolase [Paenibacillus sambharensis]